MSDLCFSLNGNRAFPRGVNVPETTDRNSVSKSIIQSVPLLHRFAFTRTGNARRTVILGHHRLLGHRTQLDLDVHHPQVLARHVHLDEPRIDRLVKLAEPGDETDGSLRDGFVRVGELSTVEKKAGDQDESKSA